MVDINSVFKLSDDGKTLIKMLATSAEHVTIPNTVTIIDKFAFEGCNTLRNIVIPNSVTTIKVCAFKNCISLESIDIPNSVTVIEGGAFYYCI